jgi:ketosteroid isomerase-like protein
MSGPVTGAAVLQVKDVGSGVAERPRRGLLVQAARQRLTCNQRRLDMSRSGTESNVILALERECCRRLQEKYIDWIVTLFADEGRQLPLNAAPVIGAKALRADWEALANTEGLEISWEPTEAHVSASGDIAYDLGAATITTPDGLSQDGKYVVV